MPTASRIAAGLRVAVIDMGTNSTRLLVAETAGCAERRQPTLTELERRSRVTRLGRGVDTTGQLANEAIDEVCATVAEYLELAGAHRAEVILALATSAVRDADNGDAFLAELRERFSLSARLVDGLEEARLTWRGAVAGRLDDRAPEAGAGTLVFDIGGGSTELIVGSDAEPEFHESLQLGVVRHSERYLNSDPPAAAQLEALADAVRGELGAARGRFGGPSPARAIAVAGTPSSLARMDLGVGADSTESVEGHTLGIEALQQQLGRLSSLPLAERRELRGLDPDRAPTIVCGTVILVCTLRAFNLNTVEVSEHDILWGAALAAADPAPG